MKCISLCSWFMALLVFVLCQPVHLCIEPSLHGLDRSLWSMRSFIHIMLCAKLFAAQLVFVMGVERTDNKVFIAVWILINNCFIICLWFALHIAGYLFSHYCVSSLHVTGCVHVDVDGGFMWSCICCTGESVSVLKIHCWLRIHHHKLWSVINTQ